jgi:hypothetical protein
MSRDVLFEARKLQQLEDPTMNQLKNHHHRHHLKLLMMKMT